MKVTDAVASLGFMAFATDHVAIILSVWLLLIATLFASYCRDKLKRIGRVL